ncbi:MAG TPA: LemA family protein [Verrucomicrobiae bacterium]|nr:LemA family protein [Verrucomicrobiae bacterium]
MHELSILAIVPIAALLILALWVILQYNGLVSLRNHIRESWSNIDTELKRRYELIPNLVQTVKGYAAHEREVLERVTELRARCVAQTGPVVDQAREERELVGAIQRLLAVVENYPDLKADGHFLELQRELVNTEDRIQAARRFYNGNVRDYSNRRETFPSNLVASAFGFGPEGFFEVEPAVTQAPTVTLN